MPLHRAHRLKRSIRKLAYLVSLQRVLRARRGDPYSQKTLDELPLDEVSRHNWLTAQTMHGDPRNRAALLHNLRILRRGGVLPQDADHIRGKEEE